MFIANNKDTRMTPEQVNVGLVVLPKRNSAYEIKKLFSKSERENHISNKNDVIQYQLFLSETTHDISLDGQLLSNSP